MVVLSNLLLSLPLVLAATIAYILAFLLRFDFTIPRSVQGLFPLGLAIFLELPAP